MSISEPIPRPPQPTLRARALEALGLAVLLAALPQWAEARFGWVLEPHPGWLVVLVLAARYGGSGLFAGLIAVTGAVCAAAALAGTGLSSAWRGLHSAPGLTAFGGCLFVSWIGSSHLRRQADLSGRLHALGHRDREARASIEALKGTVATLRARVDRTSTSLSFLRDVAVRLEGPNPVAAAQAAADLALARTRAAAAAVRVGPGGFRRLLAVRDARRPQALGPLDPRKADLSIPLRHDDECIGVLSLWGVSRPDRDETTAHDLEVIASWCAAALRPLAVSGTGSQPSVGAP